MIDQQSWAQAKQTPLRTTHRPIEPIQHTWHVLYSIYYIVYWRCEPNSFCVIFFQNFVIFNSMGIFGQNRLSVQSTPYILGYTGCVTSSSGIKSELLLGKQTCRQVDRQACRQACGQSCRQACGQSCGQSGGQSSMQASKYPIDETFHTRDYG